jgi:hypothetical protein
MFGCKEKKNNFYSYNYYSDVFRFPLIEPYEIISADKKETWSFIIDDDLLCGGRCYLGNIDKVSVIDSVILLHSLDAFSFRGRSGWLVIDLRNGSKNFYEEVHFQNKLLEMNISNYKMHDFRSVCAKFQEMLELPSEWKKGIQPRE